MKTQLLFSFPGGWELAIILILVLLLFGAKKIPSLARNAAKGIGEFKRVKREINDGLEEIEPL